MASSARAAEESGRPVTTVTPARSFLKKKQKTFAPTLFYLDPPYWGCETDYGVGVFSVADFHRMAKQLAGMQGKFLLSINDVPEIREIFAAFEIEAVETTYSIGAASGGSGTFAELLISSRGARRDLFSLG